MLGRIFRVSPRQALRIMNQFDPQSAGHSLWIARKELVTRLEELAASPDTRAEQRRRARVAEAVQQSRAAQQARHIELPVVLTPGQLAATAPPTTTATTASDWFAKLPGGIRLTPGRLEIAFETGEELLSKLFTLAQSVAANVDEFYAAVGGAAGAKAPDEEKPN